MNFKKASRQKIIDGYLQDSGRNLFIAGEFIDWLEGQPDHDAYPWFFGQDDAEAARQHRIGLARRMASGLRIVVTDSADTASVVQVSVREYPAYLSPVSGRKGGGGYQRMDPEDQAMLDELRAQGATALRGWLKRYRSAFADVADLAPIEQIVSFVDDVTESA